MKIDMLFSHFADHPGTYVRHNGVPGIFFWSLECSSALCCSLIVLGYCWPWPAHSWRFQCRVQGIKAFKEEENIRYFLSLRFSRA